MGSRGNNRSKSRQQVRATKRIWTWIMIERRIWRKKQSASILARIWSSVLIKRFRSRRNRKISQRHGVGSTSVMPLVTMFLEKARTLPSRTQLPMTEARRVARLTRRRNMKREAKKLRRERRTRKKHKKG